MVTNIRHPARLASYLLFSVWLTLGTAAQAQPTDVLRRGELLYTTHCQTCHTAQMHWRDSRLVADWDTLKQQVRRWQTTAGLGWTEDDIASVALYLNQKHYGYPQDQFGGSTPDAMRQRVARR